MGILMKMRLSIEGCVSKSAEPFLCAVFNG